MPIVDVTSMTIKIGLTESAPWCQVTTIRCPACQYDNHVDVKTKQPAINCDQCTDVIMLDYSEQIFGEPHVPHGIPLYTD